MITPDMFFFIVTNFCGTKDINIPKEQRIECVEFMTNCSFRGTNDGSGTTNEVVDSCKEDWSSYERRHK